MSAPNINLYVADGDTAATMHDFDPRPLGGKTNPYTVDIWNDKPVDVTAEAVGTGDGSNDTFALAHGNVAPGYKIYVDGVDDTANCTVTTSTGGIVFDAGSIPASLAEVTADYSYGTGAITTTKIYALSRRRYAATGDGVEDDFVLPSLPSAIYSVSVGGAETEGYSLDGNVLTFDSAPAMSAAILIYYEDEAVSKQAFQVCSTGVLDPHSVGIVDDAETSFTSVGGTTAYTAEALGGGPTVYTFANAPVLPSSVIVYEDGSETSGYTLDYVSGTIEFASNPTGAITADYEAYKGHEIGNIPAFCARKLQVRGSVPTDITLSSAIVDLEIVRV